MQQALPGLVIIPTHDPFDYTYELVQPFLADGVLTEEERRELLAYQARLYDDAGRLKAEAMPRWEKGDRWLWEGLGGGFVSGWLLLDLQ